MILKVLLLGLVAHAASGNVCDPSFLSEYVTRRACQDHSPSACLGMLALAGTAAHKSLEKLAAKDPAYKEFKTFSDTLTEQRKALLDKVREPAKPGDTPADIEKKIEKALKNFDQRMDMEVGTRSNLHKKYYRELIDFTRRELKFRISAELARIGRMLGGNHAELEMKGMLAHQDTKQNFEMMVNESVKASRNKMAKLRAQAKKWGKATGAGALGIAGAMGMSSMQPAQAAMAVARCHKEFDLSPEEMEALTKPETLASESVPGVLTKNCNLKLQTESIAGLMNKEGEISDGYCNLIAKDMDQLKKLQDDDVQINFDENKGCGSVDFQKTGKSIGHLHRIGENESEFESEPRDRLSLRIGITHTPHFDFAPASVTCLRHGKDGFNTDSTCTADIQQKITGPTGTASRDLLLNETMACESAKSYASMRPACEFAKSRDALKQALSVYSLKCLAPNHLNSAAEEGSNEASK